jgi:hypothetical protein
MKRAAFVADGLSLLDTLDELRELQPKVFAMPKAAVILEEAGIHCQALSDPLGILRIFGFGHKEIHLFGFDLCNQDGEGQRVAFEDRVFYTTPDSRSTRRLLSRVHGVHRQGCDHRPSTATGCFRTWRAA